MPVSVWEIMQVREIFPGRFFGLFFALSYLITMVYGYALEGGDYAFYASIGVDVCWPASVRILYRCFGRPAYCERMAKIVRNSTSSTEAVTRWFLRLART